MRICGPTFDRKSTRSEGLDRCDDVRAGQTHEHNSDDRYCGVALTVDGEPGAISSSGDIRYVVQESFFMVGCGISSTADYRLDVACDIYPLRRAGRYITTYPVPAASSLYEMTELVICRR